MKSRVKQLLRKVLGPALHWLSAQFGQLQVGIDALRAGQDDLRSAQTQLADVQRAVLERRDVEIEVVGRTLAVQRTALEAMEAEQRRLADEVRSLRLALEAAMPAGPSAPDAAPESPIPGTQPSGASHS